MFFNKKFNNIVTIGWGVIALSVLIIAASGHHAAMIGCTLVTVVWALLKIMSEALDAAASIIRDHTKKDK